MGRCDARIDITSVRRSAKVGMLVLKFIKIYFYLISTMKYIISPTGATKDVGAALTRICLRHRAVESRVKTLTNTLMEYVVLPLQERVEEWRRSHHTLDKDHTKEYKKSRAEIKKRTENASRLQKKAKKAGKNSELNKVLESTVQDLRARYCALEEVERSAVRHALTEERARYCAFANALRPVLVEEVGLVSELGHLQEVMTQLEKHSADPHILPPASEQVLLDIKGGDTQWSWQTPPSSPSSLGSRKSSMCSISSINSSSSSSTHSPSHHTRTRSVSQASGLSEQSCGSESSTPSPATSTATWPNLTDPALHHKTTTPLVDRPHTISSAYEKGRDRPPLTVYTFQPPEGRSGQVSPQICSQPCSPVCLELESGCVSPLVGHTATISRRSSRTSLHHNLSSSSQESLTATGKPKPPVPNRCSSLERPAVPEKKPSIRTQQQQPVTPTQSQQKPQVTQPQTQTQLQQPTSQYGISKMMPMVPDFNRAAPDMIVPQPVYSNMAELCTGSSGKVSDEVTESDGLSHASLGSSGYGSQLQDEAAGSDEYDASKYCTLRRYSDQPQLHYQPGRVVLRRHLSQSGTGSPRTGTLRRSGSHGQKPPPPVRRTPSISTISTSTPLVNSLTSLNTSSSSTSLNNSPVHLTSSASNLSNCSSVNGSIGNGGSASPSQSSSNGSPLQRTDSESSTPVGSLENLPPPPAFLLEDAVEEANSAPDPDLTTPEGIRYICDPFGPPAPIQDKCLQQRAMTVSDTVKNLQESQHQPPSPVTHRRSQSLRCNQPAYKAVHLLEERRVSLEDARASLMTTLNAKLAAQISGQQVLPNKQTQKQPTREGSQSPRMSRSRLGSVQEGMTMESPYHSPTHRQASSRQDQIYTFKQQQMQQQPVYQHSTFSQPNLHYMQQASPQQAYAYDDSQSNVCQPAPVINKDPNQQAFLQTLNEKLSLRSPGIEGNISPGSPRLRPRKAHAGVAPLPNPKPQPNGTAAGVQLQRSGSGAGEKASRVRQWIASKTSSSEKKTSAEIAALRESLHDQIKRGKSLKRVKHVADRSAPQVS
ncbi:protein MTSS 1-like isoform X2 [Penaeus japonicus]|uniref:protein MTSS 1-like isoform X2 n=1 Tax=Penaeus japonicus TaxID=27405 RepID=UPI001C7113DE|nr:protein MTSS 1-like isoform X2 [Penaeus japonicus]